MIARSPNDRLKHEAAHLSRDRSLVTLIHYSHACYLAGSWLAALTSRIAMNHGCRSAEGDSRLAELAAANNITNTRKHSFKDVLRFGLRL